MRRQIYRNRVKRDIYIHIILLLLLVASPNNGSQARLLGRGKPLFVATDAHPASAQGGELGSAMSASSLSLGEGGGRGFISEAPDTVRYAVQKTSPDNEKDLERKPADLRNPENLTTETTYDEKTHTYIVGNKIGDSYLSVPLLMTPEEYAEWSMKRSLDAYFRNKNQEEFEKEGKKEKF